MVQFHIDHQPRLVQSQIVKPSGHVFAHFGARAVATKHPLGPQALGLITGQIGHVNVYTRRVGLHAGDLVLQAHLNAGV
jgi:hypothetical protein